VSHAKTTFVEVVYGRALGAFLPSPNHPLLVVPQIEDLALLVRSLVAVHDSQGLAALVKWINEHATKLGPSEESLESTQQHREEGTSNDGDTSTQAQLCDVLCAIRLFLEHSIELSAGSLGEGQDTKFLSPLPFDSSALNRAQEHCRVLGWPSDEDVSTFFAHNALWVRRVRRGADIMVRRRAGKKRGYARVNLDWHG